MKRSTILMSIAMVLGLTVMDAQAWPHWFRRPRPRHPRPRPGVTLRVGVPPITFVFRAPIRRSYTAATPGDKLADRNHDGYVDRKEARLAWRHAHAKVNTALERKYDADENGYLGPAEARAMLRDRLRIIETHGKAIVNTDIERAYDADGDGILDRGEARRLRVDMALES